MRDTPSPEKAHPRTTNNINMKKRYYTQSEYKDMDFKTNHQLLVSSPLLKDLHPSVESVTVRYRFENDDWKIMKISPTNRFYFHIPCASYTCIHGGHNLTGDIRSTIVSKSESQSGESMCGGWEDAERVGKFHCFLKLFYEIEVKYLG